MAKTQRFHSYNLDIERLATRIETYLTENQFQVGFSKDETKPHLSYLIQGRKTGALRTAAGTRRSTDIIIQGTPDVFEVTIGTGEWGNNIIISAPLFVIPVIGIAATLTRLYTAKKFESNLWKYIREQADFLRDSAMPGKKEPTKPLDKREFDCHYVEGYPGWDLQVDGKLILERQKTGIDRVIFETSDGEQITIPAAKIEKSVIISRKKPVGESDLLLEITCKDRSGRSINPILSLPDNVITGVLAGINELVAEDKYLRNLK
jgi:hypothetical protein